MACLSLSSFCLCISISLALAFCSFHIFDGLSVSFLFLSLYFHLSRFGLLFFPHLRWLVCLFPLSVSVFPSLSLWPSVLSTSSMACLSLSSFCLCISISLALAFC